MAATGLMSDRPWGLTLAGFALERRTGELVLTADDGKAYRVAFAGGVLVAASSPLAADSIPRIALTSHLVLGSQVPALIKRVADEARSKTPRDEVDIVTEAARLSVEHAIRLRRLAILQRTARTFAVERGKYRFEERITLPYVTSIDVELWPALYQGARAHRPNEVLAAELRRLGARFLLEPSADLSCFGFAPGDLDVVDSLRRSTPGTLGVSLAELDAKHREVPPRTQQAIIYALVAANACAVVEASHAAVPQPAAAAESGPQGFDVARSRTQSGPQLLPRTITRRNPFAVRQTIAHGHALLARGADHYALLGVSRDATPDAIRSAYVALACQLHPDKIPMLEPHELEDARAVFAAVNAAFVTLNDGRRRAEYDGDLARPTRPTPDNAALADIAFRRGILALEREDLELALTELRRATELAPRDVDHAAMLAWARFCATSAKERIADEVRRALLVAIQRSPKPHVARFYLGRVERMLGRRLEALRHFREVLDADPNHAEAAAELRLLQHSSAGRAR